MKKINFLAFTALLCGYFGVQATEEATTTGTESQGTAVSSTNGQIAAAAAAFFSNQTNTLNQGTAVQLTDDQIAQAAKTYTFNYVTSTQSDDDDQELQLSLQPYSFVLSPTLSDIVQGAEQAVFPGVDPDAVASGQETIPTLYLYDGDGNLALEFDSLGAPINSWVPAASSTPIFFASTSSDLLKADLMSLAAASNGVITVEKPEAVIAGGAVESIGVSTNVPLTAAQYQELNQELTD